MLSMSSAQTPTLPDVADMYCAPIPSIGRRGILTLIMFGLMLVGGIWWQLHGHRAVRYVTSPVTRGLVAPFIEARGIVSRHEGVLRAPVQALMYAPVTSAPGDASAEMSPHLWLLRNGKPTAIPVTLGVQDEQQVEITGGNVHLGDRVIVAERVDAPQERAAADHGAPHQKD
jgi:hypothetical protein